MSNFGSHDANLHRKQNLSDTKQNAIIYNLQCVNKIQCLKKLHNFERKSEQKQSGRKRQNE